MTKTTATRKGTEIDVRIPTYNSRDVEFLQEIEDAHNDNSVIKISGGIERAFQTRIEDEFLGEDITPKTRAEITAFCCYLLNIAKFYGFHLMDNNFITSVHDEMFTIRTSPKGKITSFLDATFTYFDNEGHYKLTAKGLIRHDWATAPDDPTERRKQILRDNSDVMPGLDYGDNAEKFHIHIEIEGQFPVLVLPI